MATNNNTFQDIIALEKKIHRMLEEERQKATQWVEEQKIAIDTELRTKLNQFKNVSCKERQDVITAAEQEASIRIKKAELAAKKMLESDEEGLKDILLQHIQKILPETP